MPPRNVSKHRKGRLAQCCDLSGSSMTKQKKGKFPEIDKIIALFFSSEKQKKMQLSSFFPCHFTVCLFPIGCHVRIKSEDSDIASYKIRIVVVHLFYKSNNPALPFIGIGKRGIHFFKRLVLFVVFLDSKRDNF
jgi:hypothetical protein